MSTDATARRPLVLLPLFGSFWIFLALFGSRWPLARIQAGASASQINYCLLLGPKLSCLPPSAPIINCAHFCVQLDPQLANKQTNKHLLDTDRATLSLSPRWQERLQAATNYRSKRRPIWMIKLLLLIWLAKQASDRCACLALQFRDVTRLVTIAFRPELCQVAPKAPEAFGQQITKRERESERSQVLRASKCIFAH